MMRKAPLLLSFSVVASLASGAALQLPSPSEVHWEGLLGEAIAASAEKRLPTFIQDRNSVPLALFGMRYDYVAITRGPLVYATGLIDGFKREETLRLPTDRSAALRELSGTAATEARDIQLLPLGREPLRFTPWYSTGGRHDGSWRLTWMQIAD